MPHPLLYEVNTRCWLRALSEQSGTGITLANVPDSEPARMAKARLHAYLADGRLDDWPARARGGSEAS